ncbi:sigma-70 family RNA polymerase sigma factor (plasmid) [Streptomyces sp. NBC_01591]|uniref:sigma-70 family RNA polymerase sigma factor n=1 Tax=Streptomyces sp. NBC_01591 TaxID=2975888 RepID=UPI002DDBF59E|nr:sigma-70 family RNA polymerase sigma factor [Streptomyces sp. NBC_01591]WSD73797.1 sigma-70 family RNA polymerase sigma factor [Streptomyces sp. NBC_01591]
MSLPISPPPARPLTARRAELPEGTGLYRVHHKRISSTAFNPRPAHIFGGGRFDGTPEDPYSYLYAAQTPEAAVADTLLRATTFNPDGLRLVPLAAVVDRQLAKVRTTDPLLLIDLTTAEALHAVGASSELVLSEDFVRARAWSSVLRQHNPWAQGLLWPSRFRRGDHLVVLFGDRCAPRILTEHTNWPLAARANALLEGLRAAVTLPRPPAKNFDDFFKAHFLQICRILNARQNDWELAQEATSRAFEIAYRKWPEVSEHPNPVAWVAFTGRRILNRSYQKLASRPERPLNDSDTGMPCDGLDVASTTVDKIALYTAIGNLTRDKRECLVLHYVDGYPVNEIAELLNIPPGTVKSRLSAARKGLEDSLGYDFREGGMR